MATLDRIKHRKRYVRKTLVFGDLYTSSMYEPNRTSDAPLQRKGSWFEPRPLGALRQVSLEVGDAYDGTLHVLTLTPDEVRRIVEQYAPLVQSERGQWVAREGSKQ